MQNPDKSDLEGYLLEQHIGTYLYVRRDTDYEDSVVVEPINSEGYVAGDYSLQGVDSVARRLENGEYTRLGEFPNLESARSKVAELNDNPDPNAA